MPVNHEIQLKSYFVVPEATPIYMNAHSTETEPGIKVTIIRNLQHHKVSSQFAIHAHIVDKIFEDRGDDPRNVAYVQVCPPGNKFLPYDKEKIRMVYSVEAFLNILRVFRAEFDAWELKVEEMKRRMDTAKEKITYDGCISFKGPAEMYLMAIVEESSSYQLKLDFIYKHAMNKKHCIIHYTIPEYETLNLPPLPIYQLTINLDQITKILMYKESTPGKRRRQ